MDFRILWRPQTSEGGTSLLGSGNTLSQGKELYGREPVEALGKGKGGNRSGDRWTMVMEEKTPWEKVVGGTGLKVRWRHRSVCQRIATGKA